MIRIGLGYVFCRKIIYGLSEDTTPIHSDPYFRALGFRAVSV